MREAFFLSTSLRHPAAAASSSTDDRREFVVFARSLLSRVCLHCSRARHSLTLHSLTPNFQVYVVTLNDPHIFPPRLYTLSRLCLHYNIPSPPPPRAVCILCSRGHCPLPFHLCSLSLSQFFASYGCHYSFIFNIYFSYLYYLVVQRAITKNTFSPQLKIKIYIQFLNKIKLCFLHFFLYINSYLFSVIGKRVAYTRRKKRGREMICKRTHTQNSPTAVQMR